VRALRQEVRGEQGPTLEDCGKLIGDVPRNAGKITSVFG
jgi:hypothetical protein